MLDPIIPKFIVNYAAAQLLDLTNCGSYEPLFSPLQSTHVVLGSMGVVMVHASSVVETRTHHHYKSAELQVDTGRGSRNDLLEYDDQASRLGIDHVPYEYAHNKTTINNDGDGKKW
jgi:hypothetical protein